MTSRPIDSPAPAVLPCRCGPGAAPRAKTGESVSCAPFAVLSVSAWLRERDSCNLDLDDNTIFASIQRGRI